jgi:hypothetical protein
MFKVVPCWFTGHGRAQMHALTSHACMMNRLPRLPRKSIGAAQGSPAWASQTLGAAQQFQILLGLLANFRIRKTLGAVRYMPADDQMQEDYY